MLLFTMQALGELAVMYPVNGAFYTYVVRFVDPAWYGSRLFQYGTLLRRLVN
jgi:amino acid permease